uniref:eRF1 domain-containing protein n=1 Tax=Skeletonema marinoi TaxID=267567 RepID=A0A7S2LEK3_9STRA
MNALELGAVEHLIVWENLDINRYVLRNSSTGEDKVVHLTKEQEANETFFHDEGTGVELEVVEKEQMVEWIANHYKDYGCNLEFVTDRSGEGTQFVKGFGGIGGILRWKVDFVQLEEYEGAAHADKGDSDSDSDDSDDDYGFEDGDYGF